MIYGNNNNVSGDEKIFNEGWKNYYTFMSDVNVKLFNTISDGKSVI